MQSLNCTGYIPSTLLRVLAGSRTYLWRDVYLSVKDMLKKMDVGKVQNSCEYEIYSIICRVTFIKQLPKNGVQKNTFPRTCKVRALVYVHKKNINIVDL